MAGPSLTTTSRKELHVRIENHVEIGANAFIYRGSGWKATNLNRPKSRRQKDLKILRQDQGLLSKAHQREPAVSPSPSFHCRFLHILVPYKVCSRQLHHGVLLKIKLNSMEILESGIDIPEPSPAPPLCPTKTLLKNNGSCITGSKDSTSKIFDSDSLMQGTWIPEVEDMRKPVVGMVFKTLEDAKLFYKEYGRAGGFDTRSSSTKYLANGMLNGKSFVCSKEGETKSKSKGSRNTGLIRTNLMRTSYCVPDGVIQEGAKLQCGSNAKRWFMKRMVHVWFILVWFISSLVYLLFWFILDISILSVLVENRLLL